MKLISSLILLFLLLGCESKTVEPLSTTTKTEVTTPTTIATPVVVATQKIEPIQEEAVEIVLEEKINSQVYQASPQVIERKVVNYNNQPKQEVRTVTHAPQLPADYKEETKLVRIKGNIPRSCQMWTDGCNTCTRAGSSKANCTTYKCESNIKFSCLQWN